MGEGADVILPLLLLRGPAIGTVTSRLFSTRATGKLPGGDAAPERAARAPARASTYPFRSAWIARLGSWRPGRARPMMRVAATSSVAPPNIIVLRQSGDTFSPLWPILR